MADPGFGGRGGGRELSQSRAKPLFEARMGERVDEGGGAPPTQMEIKRKSENA